MSRAQVSGWRAVWGAFASLAAAGLALTGLTVTGVAPARAAVPSAALAQGLDLAPVPGSDLAHRMAHHRQEAESYWHQRGFVHNPTPQLQGDPGYGAANLANLPSAPWRIEHQDVTVTLDGAKGTLLAEITLTVHIAQAGVIALPLLTAPGDQVTVQQAGAVLPFKSQDYGPEATLLTVQLPVPPTPDTQVTLSVQRLRKLNCNAGFQGFQPCSLALPFQWVIGSQYFLRQGDAISAPFRWDLHVVTPPDLVAAAPGQALGSELQANGKRLWHFKQAERTHHGGFAIAAYALTEAPAQPGLPALRVYSVPPFDKLAQVHVQLLQEVAQFYGKAFVAFPWAHLGLIQLANSFGGGMAPLAGIFVNRNLLGSKPGDGGWQSSNELLAHEVAHQWWGNLVDPLGPGDVSLSESLAEYSSCLYTEKTFGHRGQMLGNNLSYVYTVSDANDRAVASSAVYSSPKYVEIVYHKGAVVMDMLRRELGDELMHKGLHKFATDFDRDVARVSDLQAAMQVVSGRNLKWFFQQWFYKPGLIRAGMAASVEPLPDGTYRVRLKVEQPDEPRRFRLPIALDLVGGQTHACEVDVIPEAGVAHVVVECIAPGQPLRVRPDVTRTLLRRFAVTTPGDVNLSGLVDGADLVDMAQRTGRAVAIKGKNGQTYFFSDPSWNELYDLQADLRIDQGDRDILEAWIGTEADLL